MDRIAGEFELLLQASVNAHRIYMHKPKDGSSKQVSSNQDLLMMSLDNVTSHECVAS